MDWSSGDDDSEHDELTRKKLGPDAAADTLDPPKTCNCNNCEWCAILCQDEDNGPNMRKRPYSKEQMNDKTFLRKVFSKTRDQLRSANECRAQMRHTISDSIATAELEQQKLTAMTGKYKAFTIHVDSELRRKDDEIIRMHAIVKELGMQIKCDTTASGNEIAALHARLEASTNYSDMLKEDDVDMKLQLQMSHAVISTMEKQITSFTEQETRRIHDSPLGRTQRDLKNAQEQLESAVHTIEEMKAANVVKDVEIASRKHRIDGLHNCISVRDRQLLEKDELARTESKKLRAAEVNLGHKDMEITTLRKRLLELHNLVQHQ
jgi:hypothetical protein